MNKVMYKLYFDQETVAKPIVFKAAMENKVEPSILRAFIDVFGGEMLVRVDGPVGNVKAFIKELELQGVIVQGHGNERDKKGGINEQVDEVGAEQSGS